MKKNVIYIAVSVATFTMCAFFPSADYSECKKELRKYVRELAAINSPSGKKVYYMNLTVKTDMSEKSRIPDSETSVDVLMSSTQRHYISNILTTYQDEKDAFAILPQRKMIVWLNGGKIPDGNDKKIMAMQIQDTLVSLSKVINCKTIEENGRSLKVLTLQPHQKAKDMFKVMRMEYFIDEDGKRIEKANTYYLPTENAVSTSITYHVLDLNSNKAKLNKPVSQLIFSEPGKLHAKFKGYQLVDNRN